MRYPKLRTRERSVTAGDQRRILIQLDTDPQPSVFDRVAAVDAGTDKIFSYGNVTIDQIPTLVHGAILTRSPAELLNTALFIGGSDAVLGEQMLDKVLKAFLGQLRVSVMLDSNGSNTTAAAAVLAAGKHLELSSTRALILGGTGPVGQRVARLLATEGANVIIASRMEEKSMQTATLVNKIVPGNRVRSVRAADPTELGKTLEGVSLVISTGAAGVRLLTAETRKRARNLKVAIDLNAIPPLGIEGIDVLDNARERDGQLTYGAIGIGDMKMKIHRAAVTSLFRSNDLVLNAQEIYALGKTIIDVVTNDASSKNEE